VERTDVVIVGDGANIVIAAKTADPHPKLPGTIYTAADAIEKLGGKALPLLLDVRDGDAVAAAVTQAAQHFGGIDIRINNASAINLSGSEGVEVKRFDLIQQINMRGTFLVSRACIPYLRKGANAHVLTLSPPLTMRADWFAQHLRYTVSKYGMSMVTFGMAEVQAGLHRVQRAVAAHDDRHRRRGIRTGWRRAHAKVAPT
jgi:citronellol/citronellal dehydrogenase